MNKRLDEINARLSAIGTECETAEGEALRSLETEANELIAEREAIQKDIEARAALRSQVAAGSAQGVTVVAPAKAAEPDAMEARAKQLHETGKMTVDSTEARAALISGGTLVTPTKVEGINDIVGAKVSSIIDQVKVVNCVGMGKNRVAYVDEDLDAAAEQTEGSTVTGGEPTFGYVDITPTSVLALAQISKQAKKQSPLMYESKVREQALISLRKKAAAIVTAALKASTLNDSVAAKVASSKGVVDEKTLRNIVLAYGGDEGVSGGATLYLNKTDLVAFGDVRGTNEKKAVYEITPDGSNPNVGTIKDGGLTVRYCINSGLTACHGTAQSSSKAIPTMFYGNPNCLELDLFSDYEIKVSEDFAFDKLLDTIRGDVELGADVVVKKGFVALTIAKA